MSEKEAKEILVYSGEKIVFMCHGTVDAYDGGRVIRITETNGRQHTVYNATVIVNERYKKL